MDRRTEDLTQRLAMHDDDLLIVELDTRLELSTGVIDDDGGDYNVQLCKNSGSCDSNGFACINDGCGGS